MTSAKPKRYKHSRCSIKRSSSNDTLDANSIKCPLCIVDPKTVRYDFQLFNYTVDSYYEIIQKDDSSHG